MIFQIKFEKEKNENKLIVEQEKRRGQKLYGYTIILTIIIVACVLIIYLLRKRKIVEHRVLELEKEKIQTELSQNEQELTKILKNLVEKNEIINTLNQEIEIREKLNDKITIKEENENLLEKINSISLLTEKGLIEFKNLFDKKHPEFYENLINKHPDLTKSEIRLAMLIRLNLSNFEMSSILGVSQDSVRKSNLRLRKKLGIKTQSELMSFIKSV